jgi:hypothetical protein
MELEEFGKLLSQAVSHPRGVGNHPLLPDKNRPGVFTKLKLRLRWILGIFAVSSVIFLPMIIHRPEDSVFLLLYLILAVESVIALMAWMQIRNIETTTGNIHQSLRYKIRALHRVFRSYIYVNGILYFLLALLIEFSIHDGDGSYLKGLAAIPLLIRLIGYTAFIAFQWFSKKLSFEKHYGDYLNKLTKILDQLREEE